MDRVGNQFTTEELLIFLDRQKKSGMRTIDSLRSVIENIDINFNHPVGRELLKDDIDRFELLLSKIVKEESTEFDRAEFRVIKSRLAKISQRMDTYLAGLKKIKE